jgi:NCS1 family nucleobase:cation symporter-1
MYGPFSPPSTLTGGKSSRVGLYKTVTDEKMAEVVRQRFGNVKNEIRKKSKLEGWVLPKQESSWAPAGTWTNIDLDVTPVARRTWTSVTILGYWFSDVISMQSWETGSTILALGLTWYASIHAQDEYHD